MSRIQWSHEDGKARGVIAGEIVLFSTGSYSDYSISRVLIASRAITAAEFESVAGDLNINAYNPERNGDRYDYIHIGDLIERFVAIGALQDVPVCEIHTETIFRNQGGPGIAIELSQL